MQTRPPRMKPIVQILRTLVFPTVRPSAEQPPAEAPAPSNPEILEAALTAAKSGDIPLSRELTTELSGRERKRAERAIRIRIDEDARNREIGQRFKRARELSGLSLDEAAVRLGRSIITLSKIESGEPLSSAATLMRAAEVYGVSIDYLLALSNYAERDPRTTEHISVMNAVRAVLNRHVEHLAGLAVAAAPKILPRCYLSDLVVRTVSVLTACDDVRRLNTGDTPSIETTRGWRRLERSIENLARLHGAASLHLRQTEDAAPSRSAVAIERELVAALEETHA